jgi:AraC-like DNA-binding protein
MIYRFALAQLPRIEHIYTVVRRTVWQVADPYQILLFIREGACRIETAGAEYVLSAGDVIFLPAAQSYRRTPEGEGDCRMLYVHFTVPGGVHELDDAEAAMHAARLDSALGVSLLSESRSFPIAETEILLPTVYRGESASLERAAAELEGMLPSFRSEDALSVTFTFCRLLAMLSKKTLGALAGRSQTAEELSAVPQKLRRAVWFIKQNESKKLSSADVARFCGLSSAQLIRYFRAAFGKTPTEYITEYKINRAREMFLTSPDLPIKAICDALGFEDAHYFSRVFSRQTGEAPSAYRYRVTHFGEGAGDTET